VNKSVAAALINKMNYTEQEKVTVKMEFSRMLTSMQLDMARNTLLTAFMEKYLVLTAEEEEIFRQRAKEELTPQEVEKLEQITTSDHEEGIVEEKQEIARKLLIKGMAVDEVVEITELPKEEVEKLVH
jgi:predicted anti-sigma-YlaC factor YlaD